MKFIHLSLCAHFLFSSQAIAVGRFCYSENFLAIETPSGRWRLVDLKAPIETSQTSDLSLPVGEVVSEVCFPDKLMITVGDAKVQVQTMWSVRNAKATKVHEEKRVQHLEPVGLKAKDLAALKRGELKKSVLSDGRPFDLWLRNDRLQWNANDGARFALVREDETRSSEAGIEVREAVSLYDSAETQNSTRLILWSSAWQPSLQMTTSKKILELQSRVESCRKAFLKSSNKRSLLDEVNRHGCTKLQVDLDQFVATYNSETRAALMKSAVAQLDKEVSTLPKIVSPVSEACLEAEEGKLLIDKNSCLGEGCQLGKWSIEKPLITWDRPGGRQIGTLSKGEKIEALYGEVHVQPARVEFFDLKNSTAPEFMTSLEPKLAQTDTLLLISTSVESYLSACRNAQPVQLSCRGIEGASEWCGDSSEGIKWGRVRPGYSLPVWWVKFKSKKGIEGWIAMDRISRASVRGSDAFE